MEAVSCLEQLIDAIYSARAYPAGSCPQRERDLAAGVVGEAVEKPPVRGVREALRRRVWSSFSLFVLRYTARSALPIRAAIALLAVGWRFGTFGAAGSAAGLEVLVCDDYEYVYRTLSPEDFVVDSGGQV